MQLNVLGEELMPCCLEPLTGWNRDGFCGSYENDVGMHQVCVEVTEEFLVFSQKMGNDLITANEYFPGLKAGDKWCLCTSRFIEALKADVAPKIYLQATSIDVLKYVPLPILQQMACDT